MRMSLPALSIVLTVSAACAQSPAARTAPDLAAGKTIFEERCSVCHGLDGGGGHGPSLRRKLRHATDMKSLQLAILNGIGTDMPAQWFLSDSELADVAGFVDSLHNLPAEKIPGDPAHGAEIYARLACATCHILDGKGNGFGPDLNEIGALRGAAQLRATVLNPASALPDGFLYVEATTSAGKTVRGVRLNEDSFTIQIRDIAGNFWSLRKSDLIDLKKLRGQTPMPPSAAALSSSDLDDLIAWLASQKGHE